MLSRAKSNSKRFPQAGKVPLDLLRGKIITGQGLPAKLDRSPEKWNQKDGKLAALGLLDGGN